ncbi:MAG: HAMP domain-containing histidine kinase [Propionibacteriaceae bacterium]|nr:HAMP domain-containing histidine kinase [Propionibacteriaceae bacterium]
MIRWLKRLMGRRGPLQDKLAALISAAVAGAITVTGIAAYLITTSTVYSQLDEELYDIAESTKGWIGGDIEGLGGLNNDLLTAANATVLVVKADKSTFPQQNALLAYTQDEVAIARLQQGKLASTVRSVDGEDFRVVVVPVSGTDAQGTTGHYALVVGREISPTQSILRSLASSLLIFGVLAAIIATAAGWVIARSSLEPLHKLTEAVARVAETDELEPIAIEGMDEVAALGRRYNEMMESLATSRERQRQLIDDAAHELRTPLTALRTNVELLVADEKTNMLPEGARGEILKDVAAQLGEFTALIGDLVHLSRDPVQAAPEPVDFMETVERALERAHRRGPNMIFDVELSPFFVYGDQVSLERAITNLLDNAVKFSPPQGTITVRMTGDRLTISDQGPGIDPADLPHVFDRFYRSDKSRNTPGSGLGLSIVMQTIKAHGGWVRAANLPQGGAEFTVRLPGQEVPFTEE